MIDERNFAECFIFIKYNSRITGGKDSEMNLDSLKLTTDNINARKLSENCVVIIEIRKPYGKPEAKKQTGEDICLVAVSRLGSRTTVKVKETDEIREKSKQLKELLSQNESIIVRLVNPAVKAFAFLSEGTLRSGVYARADDFEVYDDDLFGN